VPRVSSSSYRSRRGHIHLLRVLPLVGCRSKTPTRRVALVQSLGYNLLYVSQLLDESFVVLFRPGGSRILDSRGDLVCMVVPEGQVFRADFSQSSGVERCFLAGSSSELWK
jgi:hypothetical protein